MVIKAIDYRIKGIIETSEIEVIFTDKEVEKIRIQKYNQLSYDIPIQHRMNDLSSAEWLDNAYALWCGMLDKGYTMGGNRVNIPKGISQDVTKSIVANEWVRISFSNWCEIVKLLYYNSSFCFETARNLNILIKNSIKLRHSYFINGEWIGLNNLEIIYDDGIKSTVLDYFRNRPGESYIKGYLLYDIPDKDFCEKLLNGIYALYNRVCNKDKDIRLFYQYLDEKKLI